ncbi:MAG: serine/threonine protein kinase [Planctomycetes bacterium]|nr:serine/threonine protein kinase [Planctomycetota bacterium]
MTAEPAAEAPDWEAFHRDFRKPGYVPGYEITSKLGSGFSGHVYRARKASIGKDYAIKFLRVEDAGVARAAQMELENLRHFAQIDHPNLVAVEDRGVKDGIPYVVMAFAGAETLAAKLPQGAPPASADRARLLGWFVQATRGLAALHDHGLVHFDVKPHNVFVKGDVARLGDYGMSKLVAGSRASLSSARGTPHYMAPEVLQGRGDARSDVYSLGCLLYELLCGRTPFRGDDPWQVLKQHETAAPELPAALAPGERALLLRCLAKDPADRFASARELLVALGALAAAPVAPAVAAPVAPAGAAPSRWPAWRARLARLSDRLEPLHGGLGLVGSMVALALLAALASRCAGGGGR